MKVIDIYEPLYEAEITVLIGGTVEDMIAYVSGKYTGYPMSWDQEFDWGLDANTTNGYQFHFNAPLGDGERFYIWMHQVTPSLMAHEVFHLAGDILFTRGITYSVDSEEAFAYLGGWLFQEIYNKLTFPQFLTKD